VLIFNDEKLWNSSRLASQFFDFGYWPIYNKNIEMYRIICPWSQSREGF